MKKQSMMEKVCLFQLVLLLFLGTPTPALAGRCWGVGVQPMSGPVGTTLTFNAENASCPKALGFENFYNWSLKSVCDNSRPTVVNHSPTWTHTFDEPGQWVVEFDGQQSGMGIIGCQPCDYDGNIGIGNSVCAVSCTATVPSTGKMGETILFDATATLIDFYGTPSYEWNFGDNSPHSSDQNATHNYTQEGTYTWTMIVKVGSNATRCSKTGTITISSSPPCQLTCSATVPSTGQTGDTILFNATAASSGCSGTVSYEWDFGDNSPHSSGQNTAHNYTQEKTYTWTMIAKVDSTECRKTGTITISIAGIKITNISVKGQGTTKNVPETGSIVEIEADIEIAEGYELTKCNWTGDLTPGEGDPQNKCHYEYTPSTGIGPDIATYGNKNVTLTVSYTDTTTGMSGTVSQDHSYKVFFNKDADDQLREPPIPNWFQYWGANGAVPQLSQADMRFAPEYGDDSYGAYDPSDDNIYLGAGASGVHYPDGIHILQGTVNGIYCPGGNFGGAEGIDCATEVVEHEGHHKWIWHNLNGIWAGWANSDFKAKGPTDDMDYDDSLPDDYEISEIQTSPYVTDSCDLENYKSEIYKYYGDNEYAVMVYSNGKTGNPEKDWANPGKQANRLLATVTQGQGQFQTDKVSSKSGPTDSKTIYRSYTTGAARDIAWLTGSYSDSGIDSDGNGLYNHLKLSVGIQAASSALYVNVVAWLKDGNGNDIAWANTSVKLSTGVQTVNLFFDGRLIRGKGLDGPYKIAHVELRTGEAEDVIDTGDNVHTTAAYHYTDFDTSDVSFTKSFSDSGVDNNSDGLYDFLRILVGISVQKAGTYTVIGELKKGPESIAVARTSASLLKGNQTVNLDFSGRSIYQYRQDGPYELKALRIEDMSRKKVDAIYNAYTTRDYTYDQFQHSGTSIDADSYVDECIDLNDDGICEYLRVSFEINVAKTGFYRVSATLKDSQGETITSQSQEINLSTVNASIDLGFLGWDINSHKVDGPYQVTSVTLLSANGTLVDFQPKAYTTSDWSYLDFGGEGGPYTLTITKSGTGSGTVTSSPAGINCGSDCSEAYNTGTIVTLTTTPATGSTFTGWSGGGCSGTGTCIITMNSDKTVTATFTTTGNTATATRDLPNCYPPSGSFLVTITVTPASTTQNYAVEDAPPANWTVSSINENGQWDNVTKKVKWGPFFDHNNRTLTYMVTPPPNETGTKSFSGTASFDGVNVAIGGKVSLDKCVNICHPADTNCDYRMVISEVTAYGAAWKTGQTWQNPPNPIPIEYVTNAGYLWKVGEVYHYDATKTPPGCWVPGAAAGGQSLRNRSPLKTQVALGTGTATRELPNCYTPSGATSVSITVVPGQGTQVYAVEDAPPAGWTVSDINESGGWDNVNKKVKWGPFFDQNNRTLTYKATPPSGESGAKTFSGTVSYDGTNVTMGGDSTLGVCTAQQYTLTVSKSGTGSGTVTSSPAGIDCGSDCTETYSKVQKVKLTAKADTNSGFDGWSGGGCLGTKTCQVNVNGEITVTASFAAKIPDIVVSQDSLDFGGVKVGKSLSKTLKITNNGTGDLTITTVTGLEGTNFSISGSSSITIKSKKSYNLKVAFKPTSTGSKTATLKISSNDPHTPALEIPLSGTGQ